MMAIRHAIDYSVDASQAGCGNLEIIVNDGQVPCAVTQMSSHRFHASFVPLDATVHYIDMIFNGSRIAGTCVFSMQNNQPKFNFQLADEIE
jgi:filamin